ncbi:MAG: DUF1801 domain-containing protein [Saprospiraceae bacterium]|nr:DUF1801 domain-containing protein [Saprospiraceae bacterium]MDW8229730.1 DUF1801 domain-containing protein [Saprospiraceae bacterium]
MQDSPDERPLSTAISMTQELADFFERFSPEVSKIAKTIFEITEKILLPSKKMWIDQADGMISFGTEKNMRGEICYIKPLKDSVNLGFFHGANLEDPQNLLRGTGKSLRHVKFKKREEIDLDAVKRLIEAALKEHDERQSK